MPRLVGKALCHSKSGNFVETWEPEKLRATFHVTIAPLRRDEGVLYRAAGKALNQRMLLK